MPNELTPAAARRAREDFSRALDRSTAITELWQLRLFYEDDADYIHKEVERKLYEYHDIKLPNGGNLERGYVTRLKKISEMKDWPAGTGLAWGLMQAWQKVLPDNPAHAGWYYTRNPLKRSVDKDEFDALTTMREAAKATKERDKQWLAEMALAGAPVPVANFKIECLFLLLGHDGKVSRLVRLHNTVGETTGIVVMDAEAFHAPQKFRLWCLERGNYIWGTGERAGEKEIGKLQMDIARLAAWRVVNSVVTIGWLPLAQRVTPAGVQLDGIWFNGDCAYANTAGKIERLKADEDGIYWHAHEVDGRPVQEGYLVADEGRENAFCQKKPFLHPDTKITGAQLELPAMPEIDFESPAKMAGLLEDPNDELLRAFFRELTGRLYRAVGTQECHLLVGSFLAFAAGPELFARYSLFPGLWSHGEAESGKSTTIEWLMEIYGYSIFGGGLSLIATNTTPVGLMQAADQYSCHPMWLDEFKNDKVVGADKLGVIHNCFNRGGQMKFNASRVQRVMRTSYIVSGEATTNNAATRGRFPMVQMSKHQRAATPIEFRDLLLSIAASAGKAKAA